MLTEKDNSTINLVVHGLTPSKKNSVGLMFRGGKMFKFPNSRYQSWHKDAIKTLKTPHKCFDKVSLVHLTIYGDTKRKFDLSNKAESIMDLLVDVGYLKDDNYEVVPKLILEYGGQDKENPRCEIEIQML